MLRVIVFEARIRAAAGRGTSVRSQVRVNLPAVMVRRVVIVRVGVHERRHEGTVGHQDDQRRGGKTAHHMRIVRDPD